MRLYTQIPSIKKFPINNYNYHQNLNINLSLYSNSNNNEKLKNDYREKLTNYKPNLYSNEVNKTIDYDYLSRNKRKQSPNQFNDNKLSDRSYRYPKLTSSNDDILDKDNDYKNYKTNYRLSFCNNVRKRFNHCTFKTVKSNIAVCKDKSRRTEI